jgi:hypothetical protein
MILFKNNTNNRKTNSENALKALGLLLIHSLISHGVFKICHQNSQQAFFLSRVYTDKVLG